MVNTVILLNDIRDMHGEMLLADLQFFDTYAEMIIMIYFDGRHFSIGKYRVETHRNEVFISDYYDYRTGQWVSDILTYLASATGKEKAKKDIVKSTELFQAAERAANRGEFKQAIKLLDDIPDSFGLRNLLSVHKVEYASFLNDTLYMATLKEEYERNPTLYLQYLATSEYGTDADIIALLEEFATLGMDGIDTLLIDSVYWQ